MFYDIFLDLCADKGVKPGRAADEMQINRGTVTSWKQNGYLPRGGNLNKLAEYFGVPSDMLLCQPPFDLWEEINADRESFFSSMELDCGMLLLAYAIDLHNPEKAKMTNLVAFLKECVASAKKGPGGWSVVLKGPMAQKNPPSFSKQDERDVARDLERLLTALEHDDALLFDGSPLRDKARTSIMSAVLLGLEAAKTKDSEDAPPPPHTKRT